MEEHENTALITNDAVILGILLVILAIVFKTSSSGKKFWKKFYTYIPVVLVCYFVPSLLNTFHIVDGEKSGLYFMSTRYLLPACLFLLTMSVDMREIFRLGPKALIMFFTATAGVILGGPLAVFITSLIAPDFLYAEGGEPVWRGLTTIAGSWIGGGANQAAMYILFKPSSELYSVMITVDVIVAEIWMAVLLFGVGKSDSIDRFFNADNRSIERLKNKMEKFSLSVKRIPSTTDFMVILGLAFGATAISHFIGDNLAPWIETHAPYLETYSLTSKFFWLVVIVTLIGIITSFTKLREYEGAGSSKIGSVFIFILVASIGM
ncbi:MAG: DUF819 family protein, partial [Cyclobacteriaceae bacterium]|nr:DUF819 family protein [Cyclobacteriaceae bacterium]